MKELSCGSNRLTLNILINSLGRVEKYDATQVRCCSFAKASDVVDGMNIRLTNMASGYPFDLVVLHGEIPKRFTYVASFPTLHLSIKAFKKKCITKQAALQPNALSRTNTRDSFVVISLHSAYSGCYLLYG